MMSLGYDDSYKFITPFNFSVTFYYDLWRLILTLDVDSLKLLLLW